MFAEIPSEEYLHNLLIHPHGRRIYAALLVQDAGAGRDLRWSRELFEVFDELPNDAKNDLRKLLSIAPWSQEHGQARLTRGMVGHVTPDSKAFKSFAALSAKKSLNENSNGLCLQELANPILDKETVEALWSRKDTSESARAALRANPNAQKSSQSQPPSQNRKIYLAALAKYGDLEDPDVAETLMEEVVQKRWAKDGILSATAAALCERTELPKGMAAALSNVVVGPLWDKLAQTAGHRMWARENPIRPEEIPARMFHRPPNVFISPETKEETLAAAFEMLNETEWQDAFAMTTNGLRARIACHPNAPLELIHSAIGFMPTPAPAAVRNFIDSKLLKDSPHKEDVIRILLRTPDTLASNQESIYRSMGVIRNVSQAGLIEAFEYACEKDRQVTLGMDEAKKPVKTKDPDMEAGCLSIMSNPKFPWAVYPPNKTESIFVSPEEKSAFNILLHLNRVSDTSLESSAPEAIFAQTTSSRSLEKIAAAHPELAFLCAAHPNGVNAGIQLSEAEAKLLNGLRGNTGVPVLAGRTDPSQLKPINTLQL